MSIESSIFGIHEKALELRAKRTEVLASNLVNADTPGYKARDINFKSVLADLKDGEQKLTTTSAGHLGDEGLFTESDLKFRIPLQVKADGNTVDTQVENSIFAENSLRYIASLRFMDAKIKSAMLAIRGE